MIDICKGIVEIVLSDDRVWVNVDGECVLRVCGAEVVTIDSPLRSQEVKEKEKL